MVAWEFPLRNCFAPSGGWSRRLRSLKDVDGMTDVPVTITGLFHRTQDTASTATLRRLDWLLIFRFVEFSHWLLYSRILSNEIRTCFFQVFTIHFNSGDAYETILKPEERTLIYQKTNQFFFVRFSWYSLIVFWSSNAIDVDTKLKGEHRWWFTYRFMFDTWKYGWPF